MDNPLNSFDDYVYFGVSQRGWKHYHDLCVKGYDLDICEEALSQCYKQEQGNENMENKFHVIRVDSLRYKTYEAAEVDAKKYTAKNDETYAVVQAIAVTKEIVPEIEVVKL